jgi:hypothetical protein
MLYYYIRMEPLQRLSLMYTNINLLFVFLFHWMPVGLHDIIRASSLLVLVMVSTIWFSGDLFGIYVDLYNSFGAMMDVSSTTKALTVFCFDMLQHVAPVLYLGLPHSPTSLVFAYGLILTWYLSVKEKIGKIYVPTIFSDRSIAFGGLFVVLFFVWTLVR